MIYFPFKIYLLVEEEKLTLDVFKKCSLHPKNEDEEAINWIFLVDSLNYCFIDPSNKSHWTVTWKNEKYSGYFGLCAAINKAIEVCTFFKKVNYILLSNKI